MNNLPSQSDSGSQQDSNSAEFGSSQNSKTRGAATSKDMSTSDQVPESLNLNPLSIAVISPDKSNRDQALSALARFTNGSIREFISYPPGASAIAHTLKQDFDVVIIDLDSDPEYALELVENVCAGGSTNVIVYSAKPDPAVLLSCMRAGAREFLPMPIGVDAMSEALVRVSARRLEMPEQKSVKRNMMQDSKGKLLLFMSAKGGAGVTTLACNLAVSLAKDFEKRTLLVDMNLPLGDAALNLGVSSEYSSVNALENFHRLDGSLLNSLVVRHSSGLFVLPAPSEIATVRFENDAVLKLLRIARQEFEYVVVDAGSHFEAQDAFMIDNSATVFMITQIGIPELRNSNRLIKQVVIEGGPEVEIIVNRYDSASSDIEEHQIKKALTQPVKWRIPNDYAAVRRMQNLGTPISHEDSLIASTIRQMAESICGLAPAQKKKKKLLGIF
jgi:pilus assembly protein CpaE